MEGFTSLQASRAAVFAEAVGATVVFGEMAFGIAHERSGINGIAYFLLIGRLACSFTARFNRGSVANSAAKHAAVAVMQERVWAL